MVETSPPLRWTLRLLVVGYLGLLVGWPTALVASRTFADGIGTLAAALSDPQIVHALVLTAWITLAAVAINLVFGVTMALLLVRQEFPGRRILSALLDLPLSVSPVVVGLALLLVFNPRDGWFGAALADLGLRVVFSPPGMVMATVFVALPLMIRELVPVLTEVGDDQEWAARSLGAGPAQTFVRITLPTIRWAVLYGVVLSTARSLGEFGAVKIVSGNIVGATQTATLVVEERYQNFDQAAAYATAFLLACFSVLALVIVTVLRPRHTR